MKHLMLFRRLFILLFFSCAQQVPLPNAQSGLLSSPNQFKPQIQHVEKSVVGIINNRNYKIETFHYLYESGKLLPDEKSPVGFKLRADIGRNGITISKEEQGFSGGGLIVSRGLDDHRYVILTSSHLVAPSDTVNIFYRDHRGEPTDVVFQRRIITDSQILVRNSGNWTALAEVAAHDSKSDIAIIIAKTERHLGMPFTNPLDFDAKPDWGDWVFLFGYPGEIKQMTGGWVSQSPYPGTFSVDAVVRYGYSGGPVFSISSSEGKLGLVGVIKGMPGSNIEYIAPSKTMPPGYSLNLEDLENLSVKSQTLVNFGTAYCVHPERIKRFFKLSEPTLLSFGIILPKKIYGR